MLKQRILTALVLLPLMLLMLFAAPLGLWAAFAALIALLALWEYSRLCAFTPKQQINYVGGTALFMLAAYAGAWLLPSFLWAAAFAFWLLLIPAWLHHKWTLKGAGVRSAATGWLLVLPFWQGLLLLHADPWLLLAVMTVVWLADIAAYFVGKRFGRRKLAPNISPGKSWEGAAGGVAAAAVFGLLAAPAFSEHLPVWAGVWLAAALAALSIVGDLFESWLKRAAGVKDSGTLLPGHGGVFDRIDGLIAVVALAAALTVLGG